MNKLFEIRDTRNGEWHWVYNALVRDPHLTPAEKLIYNSLATFSGMKDIRPSFKTIGERASLSERAASGAIKKLQEVGYIDFSSGGGRHKTNTYSLLKMPKGCKFCIVSKLGKVRQETTQTTTGNYANPAPEQDIEKDIYNNIATQSVAGVEINKIISLFQEVNPSIGKYYGNKTQRGAVERMLKIYGKEKLEEIIHALPAINQKQYWPKSTTPVQLEDNLGKYKALNTQKEKQERFIFI